MRFKLIKLIHSRTFCLLYPLPRLDLVDLISIDSFLICMLRLFVFVMFSSSFLLFVLFLCFQPFWLFLFCWPFLRAFVVFVAIIFMGLCSILSHLLIIVLILLIPNQQPSHSSRSSVKLWYRSALRVKH